MPAPNELPLEAQSEWATAPDAEYEFVPAEDLDVEPRAASLAASEDELSFEPGFTPVAEENLPTFGYPEAAAEPAPPDEAAAPPEVAPILELAPPVVEEEEYQAFEHPPGEAEPAPWEPPPSPQPEPEPELPQAIEPAFTALAEPGAVELPSPEAAPAWYEPYVSPQTPLPDVDRWSGPASLSGIEAPADQLGLANPIVITLLARLQDSQPMELDASRSGIYRPHRFRPAPWSGFAYDQALDGRTGVAAGTRILTSRGEMEVENLLPGDTALTLRAPALLPTAWIGKSSATAAPILIEQGALGPDLPRRTLCLAQDQPVYIEPVPVPAKRLVNGTTIRQVETAQVDLFHIDVGKSEILFAEGVPLSSSDRMRVQAA